MTMLAGGSSNDHVCWLRKLRAVVDAVDRAGYDAVADTATPRLDRLLVGVSNAANWSRLWLATAGAVAVVGGGRGRRAACQGVLAIALTSAVTNLVLKPLAGRQRPASRSFPSGHAASAFASATGQAVPSARLLLYVAAATVAYSRVHTGVHYPSDVAIGAVVGQLCGRVVRRLAIHLAGCAATRR